MIIFIRIKIHTFIYMYRHDIPVFLVTSTLLSHSIPIVGWYNSPLGAGAPSGLKAGGCHQNQPAAAG